ncbi:MAG: GNAT family N-acetyltransferase [Pseudonocardiaceae bacterium]|nr:GNAT family N-acetyltransferase [Pseudonocardiaceae bacterium]
MHRARVDESAIVMKLLSARTEWLRQRGSDQWTTRDPLPPMARAIAAGETWLLYDDDDAIATMSMTTTADPDFWTDEERDTPTLYLSKLATRLDRAGTGLGALLVDCATRYAADRGVSTIRWDVWRSNTDLQAYYRNIGAQHVRTVTVPGRWSGALFELAYVDRRPPVRIVAPQTVLTELPCTRVSRYVDAGRGWAQLEPQLSHWLITPELRVPDLSSPDATEPEPLPISDDRFGPVLYNAGHGWRLHGGFCSHPIHWSAHSEVQPGQVYRIRRVPESERVVIIGDLLPSHETSPGPWSVLASGDWGGSAEQAKSAPGDALLADVATRPDFLRHYEGDDE